MADTRGGSIETSYGWTIATASFLLMSIGFGIPYVVVVALKQIAAEFDWPRWVPSLGNGMVYLGAGVGGIAVGWISDRIGVMWPALVGSIMLGTGAILVSTSHGALQFMVAHAVFIGLLGNATMFAPLMANVTRWFDRRRGVAVSLVASGQSVAGAIWPPIFQFAIEHIGWRDTLFYFGIFATLTMAPMTLMLRRRPPVPLPDTLASEPQGGDDVLGLPPNLVLAMLCLAIVGCCVAMAMPMVHTVAFCSDLGFDPARGAEMLSLLLASAFVSRLFWGRLSDRVGGLRTIMIGAGAQALMLSLYLAVDGVAEMFALSAAFGLAFGGIVPAYTLAVRDLFPSPEAGWRIGTIYLFGLVGMALGGWLGGYIYDMTASYRPAFLTGVFFNLANLMLISFLVLRQSRTKVGMATA
ncbi:MAG TPA: MFS transporter [Candidatus Cybelea sp.]|nr:MFS transporter [Candidatus Cybelea sp.]